MSRPLRILLLVLLAIAVIVLLFTVVFPWVDRTFVNDPVLEGAQVLVLARPPAGG